MYLKQLIAIPIIILLVAVNAIAAGDRALMRIKNEDRRIALVIGNSAYSKGSLKNPLNDARDMAAALQQYGFEVTLKLNADQRAMETAIDIFGSSLRQGGSGLFYFAGHGVQVNGSNFLIPIGANIDSEAVVKYEAVDAGRVLARMEDAGNQLNLVILDACRDNPYGRSFRSAKQGLAAMEAPAGSLVAFATAPGGVAADGSGRNGVFTKHLLHTMREKNMEIGTLMRRVRLAVQQETGGRQTPFEVSSLTGEFYLQPQEQRATERVTALPEPVKPAPLETTVVSFPVDKPEQPHQQAPSPPVPVSLPITPGVGDVWTEPKTGMEFIFVKGGCFQMGCMDRQQTALPVQNSGFAELPVWQWPLALVAVVLPVGCVTARSSLSHFNQTGCWPREQPVHEVCLDSFWLGKTEVTQSQWMKIMGNNPSKFTQGDTYPVEQVSWHDAVKFASRLSAQNSKNFRLPFEAEWEYAARSGGRPEKYAGSNAPDYVAWYAANSGSTTHSVATKKANGLGLYDMSGNVWEWVSDWYVEDYYATSPSRNPQGEKSASDRVIRGGSWLNDSGFVRSAYRYRITPGIRYSYLGFRLAFPEGSR